MFNNAPNYTYNIYINKYKILYILILFIINIKTIQSFSSLYAFSAVNNRYYMITPKNIYFLNNYNNNRDSKHIFENDQNITSEEDSQMISHGRFFGGEDKTLLIVKDYLYALF